MKYRSSIEKYYSWWLDELKEKLLIEDYKYEKETFTLFESEVISSCGKDRKISKCKYTPDFWVYYTKEQKSLLESLGIFLIPSRNDVDGLIESIIEIKPKFNFQNKNELAKVKIKWLYQKDKIFVDLVHPTPVLFAETFTPKCYLLTDSKKKSRKIEWDVINLEEKIKEINK